MRTRATIECHVDHAQRLPIDQSVVAGAARWLARQYRECTLRLPGGSSVERTNLVAGRLELPALRLRSPFPF